ncbi:MAG: SAM hydroxide adenosyltransferase, partial [Dehalococcoidia bacterium]
HILHIDRFGNLITDIRREDLPKGNLFIDVAGHFIEGLSPSYAEGEELLAIIGSSGNLEISLKNGNAAALVQAKVGDEVTIMTLKLHRRRKSEGNFPSK